MPEPTAPDAEDKDAIIAEAQDDPVIADACDRGLDLGAIYDLLPVSQEFTRSEMMQDVLSIVYFAHSAFQADIDGLNWRAKQKLHSARDRAVARQLTAGAHALVQLADSDPESDLLREITKGFEQSLKSAGFGKTAVACLSSTEGIIEVATALETAARNFVGHESERGASSQQGESVVAPELEAGVAGSAEVPGASESQYERPERAQVGALPDHIGFLADEWERWTGKPPGLTISYSRDNIRDEKIRARIEEKKWPNRGPTGPFGRLCEEIVRPLLPKDWEDNTFEQAFDRVKERPPGPEEEIGKKD